MISAMAASRVSTAFCAILSAVTPLITPEQQCADERNEAQYDDKLYDAAFLFVAFHDLLRLLLNLVELITELARMGLLVDRPNQRVHDQDGVGYALRQAAEVTDEYGQQTAAYAEYDLALRGYRAGNVVGSHEDRAEHQTAVKHLIQHPLQVALAAHREEEGDDCNGEDVRRRDVDGDDLAPEQVQAADDQRQRGGLADDAAGLAEQRFNDRNVRQSAGLEACERSRGGDRVGNGNVAEERQLCVRRGPGGHEAGPGSHHERTRAERRVHEVLADAAEQHLDNNDAEQTAEYGQPQRSCDRDVESDQNAGDEAGKIAYRVLVLLRFCCKWFQIRRRTPSQ